MRKIQIDTISSELSKPKRKSTRKQHNMYQLGFDNGIYKFTSKRELREFARACSKYLNTQIFGINSLYSDTLIQYRNIYFYLDLDQCKQCDSLISSVNFEFIRLTCYDRDRTSSYFSQHRIQKIAYSLIELLNIIIDVKFARNDHQQVHQLTFAKNQLKSILADLKEYPHNVYDQI